MRCLILVAFAAICLAGCVSNPHANVAAEFKSAARDLPQQRKLARAAGLPMATRDVARKRIPDADNAWIEIEKALQDKSLAQRSAMSRLQLDASGRARLRAFFAAADPALARIERACARPGFQVHRNWDVNLEELRIPEGAALKSLAQLFSLRAVQRAEQGNRAGTLSDLRLAAKFDEFARKDPFIISELVGTAIRNIQAKAVEQCMTLNPGITSDLMQVLPKPRTVEDIARMLATESLFFAQSANRTALDTDTESLGSDFHARHAKAVKAVGGTQIVSEAYASRALEYIRLAMAKMKADQSPIRAVEHLEAENTRIRGNSSLTLNAAGLLTDTLAHAAAGIVAADIRPELIAAVHQVRQFRASRGRYPKSLSEAGFTKLDPFSKKPYRLIIKGRDVLVYGVGQDREDNGGAELGEKRDVVARYPRALAAPAAAPRRSGPLPQI